MPAFLYVASQDEHGSILRMTLDERGQLALVDQTPSERTAYLCRDGRKLYALLREPFQMQSGVSAYDILPDGALKACGPAEPVHGTISAHLGAKDGTVYVVNYLSGSTIRMPDRLLAHNGSSVHPDRQTCSHPHCVIPTPDGKYLCICDLGTDCLYICTMDLELVSQVHTPAGSGPRHAVFSPDGKYAYCSNELNSTVSVFAYGEGQLELLHSLSTLPEGCAALNSASAIRISEKGDRLYVSNRGHNSVCVYEVSGADIKPLCWIPSGGDSPREMTVVGDWILCGNEGSHDICVLPRNGDEKTQPVCRFAVTRPWCILPVEL